MYTDTPHQHGGRPDPGQEPALVRVEGVAKRYGEAGAETVVLTNASLELARGETTSLVGVSGSGKSTLLGLIAGLMQPDSGRIVIDGQDITRLDDETTREARLDEGAPEHDRRIARGVPVTRQVDAVWKLFDTGDD